LRNSGCCSGRTAALSDACGTRTAARRTPCIASRYSSQNFATCSCAVPKPSWRMKTIRTLIGLLICIQFAGCAAADSAMNGQPPSRAARSAKDPPLPQRPLPPPGASKPPSAAPAPPVTTTPPPPAVGICDPGGCWDTGGNRYNGAAGGILLNGKGKPCVRNGVSIQCF